MEYQTMKIKTPPNPITVAAATMLQKYAPDLTAESLVKAIRTYSTAPIDATPATPPANLLRMKEAAARLGCSVRTIHRLVGEGKLPKTMLGKRSARIPEAALVRLVQEGGAA
jgi:excisionase family DNA binding protein